MAKKDNVYIALIKFVKERTAETGQLSWDECQEFLNETYPEISARPLQAIINDVTSKLAPVYGGGDQNQRKLKIESYFHLLEHEELEDARASSRAALRVAIGAIIISIIMAGIQIAIAAV